MTDEQTPPNSPSATTTPPETDPLEVWLQTTDTLDWDRLVRLAEDSRAPMFEPTATDDDELDGISFRARDEKDAAFWRERGALWGSPDYPNFGPIADALDPAMRSTTDA